MGLSINANPALAQSALAGHIFHMGKNKSFAKIGIIGGGAWGTALAVAARRAGREVVLWAREPEVVEGISRRHVNEVFLPGIPLDPAIIATGDLAQAVAVDVVLLVAPAQHLRAVCTEAAANWQAGVPAVICAKGIEQKTLELMSTVLEETLPQAPIAVLSGPTFAIEVARGQPTAITLACAEADLGNSLLKAVGTSTFRPYYSDDVIGAQVGGAVKNVLAIACGVVAGRELGDNARAAIITRGLAEIVRLAEAMGAKRETLMGLSCLGDLILTASSMQSRNMSLGAALGRGEKLEEILGKRKSVAEGVHSAVAVMGLAARYQVEMPICAAVDALINQGADIETTIQGLLARPFKSE